MPRNFCMLSAAGGCASLLGFSSSALAEGPPALGLLPPPPTGARLLDLLGVPLQSAGPYNEFTSELAERVHQSDTAEGRQLRGPSLLEVLLGARPLARALQTALRPDEAYVAYMTYPNSFPVGR